MFAAPNPIVASLRALTAGAPLGEELVASAFRAIMQGEGTPAQVGALLLGLRMRGEHADDIAGVVRALRESMVRVPIPDGLDPIDTAGTGGGSVPTFNISTAAALVSAGAGVAVAKHGNRSHTSKCGSADVFEALGVPIASSPTGATRQLAQAGIAFLFAPTFHPAMRHVAPIRRELGVPTIMNLVGPLANPAGVSRQVVGVSDPAHGGVLATVLGRLGAAHAVVVHGEPGLDEVSPTGTTHIWESRGGVTKAWTATPSDLDVAPIDELAALAGGEPVDNARRIDRLLRNPAADPPAASAVVMNAAFAIYVAGAAASPGEGAVAAMESMESGRALEVLERLRRSDVS